MPKIYDNINESLQSALINSIDSSFKSDFCVGYFNLRGWRQLADKIEQFKGGKDNQCRLLIGMQKSQNDLIQELFSLNENVPIDNKTAIELKRKIAYDFRKQLTLGYPTDDDEKGLHILLHQLLNKKLRVKLFLNYSLHAKLYILYKDLSEDNIRAYLGSSNLTMAGLRHQGELNIDAVDSDSTSKLVKWFKDRWKDDKCIDITTELIEIIQQSWAAEETLPPYYIYLKTIFHLANEARLSQSEFTIPKVFDDILFEFQKNAVLIAARYLNNRDGIMVGDVVGLGKSFIASAIMKIFEEDRLFKTLIICPANLVKMWEKYKNEYDLKADVLSIGMVQNRLKDFRRYHIVLIDESHNLRNSEGKRYKAIKDYIRDNDSKVILLTATPYNKSYIDLSTQLALFIKEDNDLGLMPQRYIDELGGTPQFYAKHQTMPSTLKAFEFSNYSDDWRDLMKIYLIRRTRSFIKNNYAKTDSNNREYLEFKDGTKSYFPIRKPKKVTYEFNTKDKKNQYARLYSKNVVDSIKNLELPRYGLGLYIDKEQGMSRSETKMVENLSRAGKRLMGFCRTGLFKRLESSGYSFLLSLGRHLLRNYIFIYAIENNLDLPIGAQEFENFEDLIDDGDVDNIYNDESLDNKKKEENSKIKFISDEKIYRSSARTIYNSYKSQKNKSRHKWISSSLFDAKLLDTLKKDSEILLKIIKKNSVWEPEKDRQLNALKELCNNTHKNDKVLIFTQYADTAEYLYQQMGTKEVDIATGRTADPTDKAIRFSPRSNKAKIKGENDYILDDEEIRVLITTDVLSEGQNLQDSHIIVNYDLPWAIIRLIQRAGRVDRIGQESDEILCYSFLPEDNLEEIINLRKRLKQRISENAEVVGSDEVFFDGDPINLKDLYNEKSGIFDEDDDNEVDLASFAYEVWKNAINANPDLKKKIPEIPNAVYSTKISSGKYKDCVILFTQSSKDNYSLSILDKSGRIVSQSPMTIIKNLECDINTPAVEKIKKHHQIVETGLLDIKEKQKSISYSSLGNTRSAKYKTYTRLKDFYENNKESVFHGTRLKVVIDELIQHPLREVAKDNLNRQLKLNISDDDLAELVISLNDDGRLVIQTESETENNEPKIICSLGLKSEGE